MCLSGAPLIRETACHALVVEAAACFALLCKMSATLGVAVSASWAMLPIRVHALASLAMPLAVESFKMSLAGAAAAGARTEQRRCEALPGSRRGFLTDLSPHAPTGHDCVLYGSYDEAFRPIDTWHFGPDTLVDVVS